MLPLEPRLTDAQRRAFASDGYCVVRDALPRTAVDRVTEDLVAVVVAQLAASGVPHLNGHESLATRLERLITVSPVRYLAALRRGAKMHGVHRLVGHDAVEAIARGLGVALPSLVSEPVLHVIGDRLVVPGGYQGFVAHQDWPSIQGSLDSIVTWIPLVAVSSGNFPLMVVPGSHRLGPITGVVRDHVREVPEDVCPSVSFVPVDAMPGDVVCMSTWTVHKTGVDGSTGFRVACSTRWDNALEPTFVERGYPCAYRRSVERDWITPDFPTCEQVLGTIAPAARDR